MFSPYRHGYFPPSTSSRSPDPRVDTTLRCSSCDITWLSRVGLHWSSVLHSGLRSLLILTFAFVTLGTGRSLLACSATVAGSVSSSPSGDGSTQYTWRFTVTVGGSSCARVDFYIAKTFADAKGQELEEEEPIVASGVKGTDTVVHTQTSGKRLVRWSVRDSDIQCRPCQ